MIWYKVKQSDLIGNIKEFPIEVVQKMVDEQIRQGNRPDVSIFSDRLLRLGSDHGGFSWHLTADGYDFWNCVINMGHFALFFEKYPKKQIKMEEKTIKINVPEGYEVDEANSTFAEIKFKPIVAKYPKSWEDAFENKLLIGTFIDTYSRVTPFEEDEGTHKEKNVFKTENQAKAMLAYAQITQLMALPCYNGDWIPNWDDTDSEKYVIGRYANRVVKEQYIKAYEKLAFRSEKAQDAFYDNHMDLLKDYFELD